MVARNVDVDDTSAGDVIGKENGGELDLDVLLLACYPVLSLCDRVVGIGGNDMGFCHATRGGCCLQGDCPG